MTLPQLPSGVSGGGQPPRQGSRIRWRSLHARLGCSLTMLLPAQILVNNAGLGRNNAHLFDGKTASWVEMVSTNVLGVCMCAREAVQVGP